MINFFKIGEFIKKHNKYSLQSFEPKQQTHLLFSKQRKFCC